MEKGIAYQNYGTTNSEGLWITQYSADRDIQQPEIGASVSVTVVDINGHTGEYVRGGWSVTKTGSVYRTNPWIQTLRWEQDGMIIQLVVFGPIGYMTPDELIAVAESMHYGWRTCA